MLSGPAWSKESAHKKSSEAQCSWASEPSIGSVCEKAHTVQWTVALRRPKRSVDRTRSKMSRRLIKKQNRLHADSAFLSVREKIRTRPQFRNPVTMGIRKESFLFGPYLVRIWSSYPPEPK